MRARHGILLVALVAGGLALGELRVAWAGTPEVVRCAQLPGAAPSAVRVRLEDCRVDPVGALALTRTWRAFLNAESRSASRKGAGRIVLSREVFLPVRALGAPSDSPPVAVVRTHEPSLVALIEALGRPGAPPPDEVLASHAAQHPELLARWGPGRTVAEGMPSSSSEEARAREALGPALPEAALLLEEGARPSATSGLLLLTLSLASLGLFGWRMRSVGPALTPQELREEESLELGQLAALREEERSTRQDS